MLVPKYLQTEINVKVESPEYLPRRAHSSDAGADLVCKETTYLPMNYRVLVKTGVAVEIPVGFVGLLFPRSSLSKLGIVMTNSVGVIDSDYRGEIMASLMYTGGSSPGYELNRGDRIVQLVVVPIVLPEFKSVEELSTTYRGSGGFGSTGVV
jgi:dUTP pyrophosphatase